MQYDTKLLEKYPPDHLYYHKKKLVLFSSQLQLPLLELWNNKLLFLLL
jgi:hypothetical protein